MSEIFLNSLLNKIQANTQRLLFVWSGASIPHNFQQTVEQVQRRCGAETKLNVEHADRLTIANYEPSSFDCIVSNLLTTEFAQHTADCLGKYLRLLKPNGLLAVYDKATNLESELKLNGYLNVQKEQQDSVWCFYAQKPNFEVGQARKLTFASKVSDAFVKQQEKQQAKVWQFSADDVQEDDLINTDDLLDELDLKKPVLIADSKFDCGTSNKEGKKKACKNCSCGLAEELESEAADKQQKNVRESSTSFKSACGSCYLGDAFRCASCPYLGMPAFRPGEKVQLNDFGKADI